MLFESYSESHTLDHEIRAIQSSLGGDIEFAGANAPLGVLHAAGVKDGGNPLGIRRHVIERLAYEAGSVADANEAEKDEPDLGAGARLRDEILLSI